MGREDPVVEHESDAGARGEGRELFEELEEEVTCAVGPRLLQLPQDASVAGELETILSGGRPQRVAAALFASCALFRRPAQVSVEIEAFEVRLAGPSRADPGGIRLVPEAQETRMLPQPRSGWGRRSSYPCLSHFHYLRLLAPKTPTPSQAELSPRGRC
jgi:hypothetical protein